MNSTISFRAAPLLRFALINLLLVSILGGIMRYKISFAMPWIDQKHILHAHSHLAFVGWVSHTLMVLIGLYIHNFTHKSMKRLMPFIILNLVAAYGMLISFV
ncbi:MAG TPA: hypothetical protein PK076_04290, partial [Saprospiraceae bacterium]|nr:hypothetical protein [Saprospiraceae bacterium]